MPRIAMILLGITLTASACSSHWARDQASQFYQIPPGSRFVLHADITVPAASGRLLMQGGKAVPASAVQRFDPQCELRLRDVSDSAALALRADVFSITRAYQDFEYASRAAPLRLASLDLLAGVPRPLGGFSGDGNDMVAKWWVLLLSSPRQPNVIRLSCTAGWEDETRARYPTLAQMRDTLGALASIEIAP